MRPRFPDHLYVTDLDGTLLQPDATLSDYARKGLQRLLENDFPMTIATARSVVSVREILGDLPFRLPVICTNGGSVYQYHDQKALHRAYIRPDLLRHILEEIAKRGDAAFVSAIVEQTEKVMYRKLANAGMEWYVEDRRLAADPRVMQVANLMESLSWPVTTVTFMDRRPRVSKLRKYFTRTYGSRLRLNFFENKYSPGWYWLSLHAPESDKARAIDFVLDHHGVRDCHLTVFGDEWNDLPMFRRAHRAIAVGNALPEVKRAAHEIIGEHREDAVIRYVLREAGL